MSVSYIFYKDIAPGADEEAVITATGGTGFSAVSDLARENQPLPPIATLEPGRWLLDGAFSLPPVQTAPYWSEALSGPGCVLDPAPVIDIHFASQHSSVGLTLVFDPATGEHCRKVRVQWYQGEEMKAEKLFFPDAASYVCENTVTSWDRVTITLLETSRPRRRARLTQVIFGIHRRFGMAELRNVKLVEECDLSGLTLPVSTMDWQLDSRSDIQFMFQFKQPVEVWNSEKLVGVYYIDGFSRSALYLRSISCYDALGVLDEAAYPGGVYKGMSARALLEDIVSGDFALDIQVEDARLSGAILPGSKREAMQQVLFAWGALVSTDGRYGIRVFRPEGDGVRVGPERVYVGASVDTAAIVTEVRVTAHTYTLDANGSVEIGGQKYADATQVFTVSNPDKTSNDKENVIRIENATLVSPDIAQAVAQRLYSYYMGRDTVRARAVWQGERLGDKVWLPTPWGTGEEGILSKMEITLSNTVAANVEARG